MVFFNTLCPLVGCEFGWGSLGLEQLKPPGLVNLLCSFLDENNKTSPAISCIMFSTPAPLPGNLWLLAGEMFMKSACL